MSSATDLTMKDKLAFFKAQKALQLQKKEENIRPNKSGIFHAKALEEGVHAKKMEEGIQRCTTIEHPTENEEEIYFLQSRMIQSPVAFTEASKLHEQHLESLAVMCPLVD